MSTSPPLLQRSTLRHLAPAARGGRPPFPTELMVRVLLIQQLFNLSDEQMEFQLLDRLSFQRLVGLRANSGIPDRTTTFMERLIQAGASETVFDAVNRQLSRHGYIARGNQMIDTSIVQAPTHSLSKEEEAIVSEGAMPADGKPAKQRQKDMDARWTKKHGKSYFGYKVSANADKRYKLVRKIKGARQANTTPRISRMCSIPPTRIGTSWPTRAMSMASAKPD